MGRSNISKVSYLQEFAEVRSVEMCWLSASGNSVGLAFIGDPFWDCGYRVVSPHGSLQGRGGICLPIKRPEAFLAH